MSASPPPAAADVAAAAAPEPRRGARNRKQPVRLDPINEPKPRPENSDDEVDSNASSELLSDEEGQLVPPQPGKRKANGADKDRAAKPSKRSRKAPPKTVAAADIEPTEGFATDSPLFNALLSPDVALQPLVEDWVHAYQGAAGDADAEKAAVHELVLFFVRTTGLTADVNEDEAMDQDGVGDTIERIQDESVSANTATYPLISKDKRLKPFKSNLSTVVSHFISTLYLTPYLFEDAEETKHSLPLMPLLLSWLHSMATSPLRAIRHTATFIALKINTALCEAGTTASNDLSLKQRQLEAEAKKSQTTAAAKRRLQDAEDRVKNAHERKTRLEEYMKEIEEVMFVHRLRDSDHLIRSDCLRELGTWAKKYPEKYASTAFLNYFVRGSNDPESHVRLETVKALASFYAKESAASNVGTFTLRIAPRLIQMASLDNDLSVRVNAIAVITYIDRTGALQDEDEEQRDKVARLIFDEEPRVRKVAAGFLKGLWEERTEQLLNEFLALRPGKKKRAAGVEQEEMELRFQWKALASLLVETSATLQEEQQAESTIVSDKQTVLSTYGQTDAKTRAAAAADALWHHIDLLQDWQALVDYLLLDHSTAEEDKWLLTEEEEDLMLDMFVTSIKREQEDEDEDDKTKALMKVLPRLFTKHQSEVGRIRGVLSIPQHMNLSLYLDMRKGKAYEALWDEVTKQFLHHTDSSVLSTAIQTINVLNANSSMTTINTQKMGELEETLFTLLREEISGEDVASMTIDDDRATSIEAILHRIKLVIRSRDLINAMEDEEGGQSSGWTIACAFAGRGGLGFAIESTLVQHALQIIFLHLTWLVRRFSAEDADDETKVDKLRQRQEQTLEILDSFGVGVYGRTSQEVRRQAFMAYIELHLLFKPKGNDESVPGVKVAVLMMPTDKQHKLGGAFQAMVERYISDLEDDEQDDDEELSLKSAQRHFSFLQIVASFVAAIRCGVVDVEQAKEPLAHYGRFGTSYDAIIKKLVDVLRDEGIYNKEATTVQHVVSEALQNSFTVFLDSEEADPEAPVALARLAASAFVVHGTHFTVLKQIHPNDVFDLHIAAIDWVFREFQRLVRQAETATGKKAKLKIAAKRTRLLHYFRPLALLLNPITGRHAMRIRQHFEQTVEKTYIPEAFRRSAACKAYENRLFKIAGRDSALKVAQRAKRKSTKSAAAVEDSDEEGTERDGSDADEDAAQNGHGSSREESLTPGPADRPTPPPATAQQNAADGGPTPDADSDKQSDTASNATPTPSGTKRKLAENENGQVGDLPPLNILSDADGIDEEIDLAFSDLSDRGRSESGEPESKRRKTSGAAE